MGPFEMKQICSVTIMAVVSVVEDLPCDWSKHKKNHSRHILGVHSFPSLTVNAPCQFTLTDVRA